MFEALGDKLSGVFDNLTGRGALSEKDVAAAMREIRVALLEADVALPVVKDFVAKVKEEAVGEKARREEARREKARPKEAGAEEERPKATAGGKRSR